MSRMNIVKFDSLESTNKYCEALDLTQVEDFTCYWALSQTAGIGQRGNHWEAAPRQNLTFSLVLHPTFLSASHQFRLTQALSLAICDFLSPFTSHLLPSIKWPNDIYVRMSSTTEGSERHHYGKICGTLVSTRLSSNSISSAICGIGFNVNQTVFPEWVPNPTSLALLARREFDLEPLLRHLLDCIEARYNVLREGRDLDPEYLDCLLNLGVSARYRYGDEVVLATITGVDPFGRLLLVAADGRRLCCGMKEIALL